MNRAINLKLCLALIVGVLAFGLKAQGFSKRVDGGGPYVCYHNIRRAGSVHFQIGYAQGM